MRSSMLRILMAIVVGLWSPLCCCQAAVLAGILTGSAGECAIGDEPTSTPPAGAGCCDRCRGESADPGQVGSKDGSGDENLPTDGTPCETCAACQGVTGWTRLDDGGSALKALASAMSEVLTPAPTVLVPAIHALRTVSPPRPPEHLARASGGRVLLRWHCALVV